MWVMLLLSAKCNTRTDHVYSAARSYKHMQHHANMIEHHLHAPRHSSDLSLISQFLWCCCLTVVSKNEFAPSLIYGIKGNGHYRTSYMQQTRVYL
jgi:hypothetical protein